MKIRSDRKPEAWWEQPRWLCEDCLVEPTGTVTNEADIQLRGRELCKRHYEKRIRRPFGAEDNVYY